MKKKQEYYGIYINNKIPNLEKENGYSNRVIMQAKGKLYYAEDKGKKELQYKEAEEGSLTKRGKYIIKFIRKDNKEFIIHIKIINTYFLILLLFLFLGLFGAIGRLHFNNKHLQINNPILIRSGNMNVAFEGKNYIFDVSQKDSEIENIKLVDTLTKKEVICPRK